MAGWIKLHRKIKEHWLWKEKPFDKRSAWIDMLLMANHDDNKFLLGNELVEVKKGSFITSELKLMERWGWSKTKVRGFLKLLENDSMIIKKTDRKKTTIFIENYSEYQDKQTTEKPQEDHEETTKEPREDTNKNVKNVKKVKKNKKDIYISGEEEQLLIDESLESDDGKPKKDKFGEFEKVSLTTDEFNKLLDKLGQARTKDMIARLDTYKASKGKNYADDYATILNWNRKDIAEGKYKEQDSNKKPKESSNPFIEMMQEELEKEAQQNDKS